MTNDHLLAALRELARAVAPHDIQLTIGGGYGLVMRDVRQRHRSERTRVAHRLPQRGTEDLDFFLDVSIVTNVERMAAMKAALDTLGYVPLVKYMQFLRPVTVNGVPAEVKVDLLTGPVPAPLAALVERKDMRVKPKRSSGLHAYHTPEAFSVELGRQEVDIGDGNERITVSLLHPFSYLILKLFALRDRLREGSDVRQRYHALDLFSVWASLTEREWEEVCSWSREHADHPTMVEARSICRSLFGNEVAAGVIALRDQLRQRAWSDGTRELAGQIEAFRLDLLEIMTRGNPAPP